MDHKLSNQAVGAIMMALQKSLLEQSDITPVLQGFQIQVIFPQRQLEEIKLICFSPQ